MSDIHQTPSTTNDQDASGRQRLLDELSQLEDQIEALRARLDTAHPAGADGGSPDRSPAADRATSRRRLLHLAGASAVGAVGGALATGRPAAAADPNDVVKNVPNLVTDTTTLDGTFPGPVLSLFNRSTAASARALYAYTDGASPAVRADNNGDVDAVGVAANAPAGVDLHATGSGRISMDDHAFGGGNDYSAGELHQVAGTMYAMVTDTVRRVVAAPGSAGAFFPIEPIRVYDSRLPTPRFGAITSGESRTVAVDDARDPTSGVVVERGVVPGDATAVAFNLTVVDTVDRGYLSVTPDPAIEPGTATINWRVSDDVVANSSTIGIGGDSEVSVFCGGIGATDFVMDVVGYYR